jgi:hypothetical protein
MNTPVSGVFLLSDYTTEVTMAEQTMSLERAMENAIVSTEIEGFVVTREQRELMVRVLKKEITLEEAISMLSKKYK